MEFRGREPIAIIGMSCRFPGANSPSELWSLVREGASSISETPKSRFDVDALFDETPRAPGKVITRWGGYLAGIDQFDPFFFRISPREAAYIDPQQRLLLELSLEALEDAGLTESDWIGSDTGVYVGIWRNDYEDRMTADEEDVDVYVVTGGARFAAAGRVSHAFDLRGPSLSVDTACSSSLVAVHMAARSIWSGECGMAIAGGVNVILDPYVTIAHSRSGMLSADGRCKFGDATADGYVRSEGCGVVLLKPYAAALADGDPIHALVLGSAVNCDGRSNEYLMSPSVEGQADMLRAAYRDAGIPPGTVGYVEAHGTGTDAGDPVELEALGSVLSEDRPSDQPCAVGSVKGNIGHTEGAAGLAGLIKAALMVRHGEIPGTLHLDARNPSIRWQDLPLSLSRDRRPWEPAGGPRRAGVSSFGISGTNAHVVLQQPPVHPPQDPPPRRRHPVRVLPISAHTDAALLEYVRRWSDHLTDVTGAELDDLLYTSAVRRSHRRARIAVSGESAEALRARLDSVASDPAATQRSSVAEGPPRIVFVYPGQGSQWLGMGRELLECSPAFRCSLERTDQAIRAEAGWSPLEALTAPEPPVDLDDIGVIQPLIFAVQVALTAMWRALGVTPDSVVGHSMGEVAAACCAGALELEEAVQIICRRSALLRRVRGKGGMALVELSAAQAEAALRGYEDQLSVAVSNSSRSTVVAGETAALDSLIAQLEQREVFCRRVKVDVASHSPQVDPLRPDLLAALAHLAPTSAETPILSTVTAGLIDGAELDAGYWVRNLREPVRFSTVVGALLERDGVAFLEIGPHPVLMPAVQQELQHRGSGGTVLPSVRRHEEWSTVMESLAELYGLGVDVDWRALHPEGGRCVAGPSYPWQRDSYWYNGVGPETRSSRGPGTNRSSTSTGLLGSAIPSSLHDGVRFWETGLDVRSSPWLADHRVGDSIVAPATLYVTLTLQAAAAELGEGPVELVGTAFPQALVLSDEGTRTVQLAVREQAAGCRSFQLSSRSEDAANPDWTPHAAGVFRRPPSAPEPPLQAWPAPPGARMDHAGHYALMSDRDLHYGEAFRCVDSTWRDEDGVWARIGPTGGGTTRVIPNHPALLDAAFQVFLASIAERPEVGPRDTYVPDRIESLIVHRAWASDESLLVRVPPEPRLDDGVIEGDLTVYGADGAPVAEVRGLRIRRLDRNATSIVHRSLFELQWTEQALAGPANSGIPSAGSWLVIAEAQQGYAQDLRHALETNGLTCAVSSLSEGVAMPRPPEGSSWAGLVDLRALERTGDVGTVARTVGADVLDLVQRLTRADGHLPRLWIATREAHSLPSRGDAEGPKGLALSSIWGLRRVVASEHPGLRCSIVDLGEDLESDGLAALAEELLADSPEDEVAIRGRRRWVTRLAPWSAPASSASQRPEPLPAGGRPFRVEASPPGVIDNLVIREAPLPRPGGGEVLVEVCATGLNFMNVMAALDVYPTQDGGPGPLGIECAGRIAAVGEGAQGLAVGSEVFGFVFDCLGSHALADAQLVRPMPSGISFHTAATIPIAFVTAHYALEHLGRLRDGERVLIHSAAGGVGMAALQLARRAGAEVYATAGTPEKRQLLSSMGIEHVMDSRSLEFAEEIMEATGGEGVDVVLNSLAGEAMSRSLGVLRPYGRFVELGKRDIYDDTRIGLAPFRDNRSYFAVDLDGMARQRPDVVRDVLVEVSDMLTDGALQPLPHEVFSIERVVDAFRHMATGRHTGKIVINVEGENPPIELTSPGAFSRLGEGTVLITGGLGALGLITAEWLVEEGARSLALVGRKPDPGTDPRLEALRGAGAQVRVLTADVSQDVEVRAVVDRIEAEMPPLIGVIHAAGVLDDVTLTEMTADRFETVMAPKVDGAWNLHRATTERDLDFFILYSSIASLVGNAGQGNYAAANAFLDGLAAFRQELGLRGTSINWGPWSQVGLAAARSDRGQRLDERGLLNISPREGVEALAHITQHRPRQVAVMPTSWARLAESDPQLCATPRMADLVEDRASGGEHSGRGEQPEQALRARLMALDSPSARAALVLDRVRGLVGAVVRMDPSRVDTGTPLRDYGLDSLMALELRNRLEASFGLALSGTLVFNYPTASALAGHLGERMEATLASDGPEASATPVPTDEVDQILSELEGLTPDELDRLLGSDGLASTGD